MAVPSLSTRRSLESAANRYAGHVALAVPYLQARGLIQDSWNWAGLGVVVEPDLGHEALVGRLSVPYRTKAGVWAIKARCIRCPAKCDGHPKYLTTSGVELPLFNVNAFFQPSGTILVTEGELDALAVQQATGLPAVGYPGTSGWKPHYARCFSGYSLVVVVADGDEPGRESAKSVAKELGRTADTVRVVRLDDGMDASSVLASHGAAALKELIGV